MRNKPVRQPVNHTLNMMQVEFPPKVVSAEFVRVCVQLSGEAPVTQATVNSVKPKPTWPCPQKETLQDLLPVQPEKAHKNTPHECMLNSPCADET